MGEICDGDKLQRENVSGEIYLCPVCSRGCKNEKRPIIVFASWPPENIPSTQGTDQLFPVIVEDFAINRIWNKI